MEDIKLQLQLAEKELSHEECSMLYYSNLYSSNNVAEKQIAYYLMREHSDKCEMLRDKIKILRNKLND